MYAIEIGSGVMICSPSFMKIDTEFASPIWKDVMLVLLSDGIYQVRRWNGFMKSFRAFN